MFQKSELPRNKKGSLDDCSPKLPMCAWFPHPDLIDAALSGRIVQAGRLNLSVSIIIKCNRG